MCPQIQFPPLSLGSGKSGGGGRGLGTETALTDSRACRDKQIDTKLKTLAVRPVDDAAALPQAGAAGNDKLKVLNGTWEAGKKQKSQK